MENDDACAKLAAATATASQLQHDMEEVIKAKVQLLPCVHDMCMWVQQCLHGV